MAQDHECAVAELLDSMLSTISIDGDDNDDSRQCRPKMNPTPTCTICGQKPSIYRCPKCLMRTCSLNCVLEHKQDSGCDGIRDRTAFISLGNFADLDLLSDYRFLEEAARCVSNAERNPGMSRRRHDPRFGYRPRLPYRQHRLIVECRNRGTRLQIMPETFKRRRDNATRFCIDEGKLYWRIAWEFPQANASYTDDEVDEDCLLETAVEKYLCPEDGVDPTMGQCLAFYQSVGFRGVVPLMKIERVQSATLRYVELDFSETIASNLEGKTVIEFPTILLVLRDHVNCYSIVEDEKEEEDHDDGSGATRGISKWKRTDRTLSEGECSSSD